MKWIKLDTSDIPNMITMGTLQKALLLSAGIWLFRSKLIQNRIGYFVSDNIILSFIAEPKYKLQKLDDQWKVMK